MKRIFDGDPKVALRKGFKKVYGNGVDADRAPTTSSTFTDYEKMLAASKDIEAVVIAVPLHLHAPVAIDCHEGRQARPVREADGLEHRRSARR